MKTFLPFALLLLSLDTQAQITYEYSHPYGTGFVNLETAGVKYYRYDPNNLTISLYDLDHTLYKQMVIPGPTGSVFYVRESLFDTDSTDLEYLVFSNNPKNTSIYDEAGNTLFSLDSVSPNTWLPFFPNGQVQLDCIFNTDSGTVMLLRNQYTQTVEVYSLPGYLECMPCGPATGGGPNIVPDGGNYKYGGSISNPYPNPTRNGTRVDYSLPDGVNSGEIIFYDLNGNEVKRFSVGDQFNYIYVSTSNLAAGSYFYNLQTSDNYSSGKKLVVIK